MIFLSGVRLLRKYSGNKSIRFQSCAKAAIPHLRKGITPRVISFSSIHGNIYN